MNKLLRVDVYAGSYYHYLLVDLLEEKLKSMELSPMMRSNYEQIHKNLKKSFDENKDVVVDIEDPNIEGFG